MPPPLILASTSPYRKALLERLGIPFSCMAPACDEEALKDPRLPAHALAAQLAEAKARSLAGSQPGAVLMGSDQVCCHQGAILGKPGTRERAQAQLGRLAGGTHQLITALAVVHGPRTWRHLEVAELDMRALDAGAIARYLERDRPWDCAGSYKLEAGGIALFSAIRCADHSAITGLPLLAVVRILAEAGWQLP